MRDAIQTLFSWYCSGKGFLHEAYRWSQVTGNLARASSLFKKLFAGPSPPEHSFDDNSNDFESTGEKDNFEGAGEDEDKGEYCNGTGGEERQQFLPLAGPFPMQAAPAQTVEYLEPFGRHICRILYQPRQGSSTLICLGHPTREMMRERVRPRCRRCKHRLFHVCARKMLRQLVLSQRQRCSSSSRRRCRTLKLLTKHATLCRRRR